LATIRFQGLASYIRSRSLANLVDRWGWKDPRNTYALPLWLDVFPDAQVINVYRNGIDVANSLYERELRRLELERLTSPLLSCRCLSLEHAFDLWTEYVEMSFGVTADLGASQVLHVQYESLLQNPRSEFTRILQFCKVDNIENMLSAVDQIRPDRAYAFLDRPKLVDFYSERAGHPYMVTLGYGDLIRPDLKSEPISPHSDLLGNQPSARGE
jgi:hypothetical protein